MKKKNYEKMFVVRKYVKAESAEQAIKKEKKQKPDDVWVDEDWKKNNIQKKDAIGFRL